jgi:signal transduction histidine kinase
MPPVAAWWRRRSLRARLTVITTAGLAVALLAGAALLHVTLRDSLTRGLEGTARQAGRQVAALADAHRLPATVPVAAGTLTVQVLNGRGVIVSASPGADRLVPLLAPVQAHAAARTGEPVLIDGRPFGIPYRLLVVAVAASGGQTVLAAVDFAQVRASVVTLTRALTIGTPLLLLLLAVVTWLVVGSTLRPISALRRGAQEVTATGRPRALPVPQARDEVRVLAVTLNDMLARLGAAQQRQRGLISDTAHELRSPIASIQAQLEVALDHPGHQDWRQTASGVLADTLRLARLAEDLLVLARLDERGDRAATGKPVDLAALAREEAGRAGGARVPVTVTADGGCQVSGDKDGLRRLLRNLIENALRYASTRVEVSAGPDGEAVRLTVTDDGPGIAPQDRERVFGRFVRLDDARSRDCGDEAGGAGLGLAIVLATAQAHGGTAWLEDAAPGLRAVVILPADGPQAEVVR